MTLTLTLTVTVSLTLIITLTLILTLMLTLTCSMSLGAHVTSWTLSLPLEDSNKLAIALKRRMANREWPEGKERADSAPSFSFLHV